MSLVVPEYQLGTAYGMMQSIQNLGLALVNIASGAIATKVCVLDHSPTICHVTMDYDEGPNYSNYVYMSPSS